MTLKTQSDKANVLIASMEIAIICDWLIENSKNHFKKCKLIETNKSPFVNVWQFLCQKN